MSRDFDYGVAAADTRPNYLGHYPGYEADMFILEHVPVLTDGTDDSGFRAEVADVVERRHDRLQLPDSTEEETNEDNFGELRAKAAAIADVWIEAYLCPRVMDLDETTYLDWAVPWLYQGVAVERVSGKMPAKYGAVALNDIQLPPLFGASAQRLLVPPSTTVEHPRGLGHSELLVCEGTEPLVTDGNGRIKLFEGMPEKLYFEQAVPLKNLPELRWPED